MGLLWSCGLMFSSLAKIGHGWVYPTDRQGIMTQTQRLFCPCTTSFYIFLHLSSQNDFGHENLHPDRSWHSTSVVIPVRTAMAPVVSTCFDFPSWNYVKLLQLSCGYSQYGVAANSPDTKEGNRVTSANLAPCVSHLITHNGLQHPCSSCIIYREIANQNDKSCQCYQLCELSSMTKDPQKRMKKACWDFLAFLGKRVSWSVMINVAGKRQGHSARVAVQDPCPTSVPCLLLVSLSSQRPRSSGFHNMHFSHPSGKGYPEDPTLKPNALTYQRKFKLFRISFPALLL